MNRKLYSENDDVKSTTDVLHPHASRGPSALLP